jgi:hypothetical protein
LRQKSLQQLAVESGVKVGELGGHQDEEAGQKVRQANNSIILPHGNRVNCFSAYSSLLVALGCRHRYTGSAHIYHRCSTLWCRICYQEGQKWKAVVLTCRSGGWPGTAPGNLATPSITPRCRSPTIAIPANGRRLSGLIHQSRIGLLRLFKSFSGYCFYQKSPNGHADKCYKRI